MNKVTKSFVFCRNIHKIYWVTICGQDYMHICAILMEIHIPQTEAVANSAALSSWTKYWEVLSHPTTPWSRSSIREIIQQDMFCPTTSTTYYLEVLSHPATPWSRSFIREVIQQDIFCSSTHQYFETRSPPEMKKSPAIRQSS